MFCGDDTGSVVGEIAGYYSRFGNSGEDLPKYQVPSDVVVAGVAVGGPRQKQYRQRRPNLHWVFRRPSTAVGSVAAVVVLAVGEVAHEGVGVAGGVGAVRVAVGRSL